LKYGEQLVLADVVTQVPHEEGVARHLINFVPVGQESEAAR